MQADLGRILKRMEKRRFPANDELQQLTREAFDKLQHLKMKAHYLGCTGVGNQVSVADDPAGRSQAYRRQSADTAIGEFRHVIAGLKGCECFPTLCSKHGLALRPSFDHAARAGRRDILRRASY